MRIALLSLLVTAVAVAIIAIGVLGVAQATFNRLMLEAGQSAATARTRVSSTLRGISSSAIAVSWACTRPGHRPCHDPSHKPRPMPPAGDSVN